MSRIIPEGRHRTLMLALLIAGVILAAVGIISDRTSDPSPTETDPRSAYERDLESRVEDLCKSVYGIDSAKALVTLDRSAEKITADSPVAASGEIYPTVRGVAVVVTGGDRADIRRDLTELISSSLGIPTNRIAVAPAK